MVTGTTFSTVGIFYYYQVVYPLRNSMRTRAQSLGDCPIYRRIGSTQHMYGMIILNLGQPFVVCVWIHFIRARDCYTSYAQRTAKLVLHLYSGHPLGPLPRARALWPDGSPKLFRWVGLGYRSAVSAGICKWQRGDAAPTLTNDNETADAEKSFSGGRVATNIYKINTCR
eukprot:SAG31_NODE_66_length_28567_cov_30.222698_17_plen_170_part_00